MTKEQIEQDAIKYCDDMWGSGSTTEQEAFVAGALSRQPEIDQLTADIERYKKDVTAYSRSIRTARKIIGDKRVENEKLTEALGAMLTAAAEGDGWEGAIYNAEQILKKHEK